MHPSRLQSLSAAAAGGDRKALTELLEHYLPEVRAYVRLHADPALRARESSSDLVQSVCRQILERADSFRHPDEQAFKRWLFTTALRTLRDRGDFHRAGRRDLRQEVRGEGSAAHRALLEAYSGILTPSRDAGAREELERVERAMDALPEDYREVILEVRVLGSSHAALAERLGKSEGAVRMLLHRALARLVAELEGA